MDPVDHITRGLSIVAFVSIVLCYMVAACSAYVLFSVSLWLIVSEEVALACAVLGRAL